MERLDQYHKSTRLDLNTQRGTPLKRNILEFRKKSRLFSGLMDKLLGIPALPKDAVRILDIGCGSGYALSTLRDIYPYIEPYGVDIIMTEDLPQDIHFHRVDLEHDRLPFDDNFFDFVMCRSVMEHLRDPSNLFFESYRVLKAGGTASFLTENFTALFLPVFGLTQYTVNFWDDYTHIRPYTKRALKRLFQISHYRDIRTAAPRNFIIILILPILMLLQLTGKADVGRLLFEIFAPDLIGKARK